MKLTLRDPIGNSVEFDSSPADIYEITKVAKAHLVSSTETPSYSIDEKSIFVDNVMLVISDYVISARNPS